MTDKDRIAELEAENESLHDKDIQATAKIMALRNRVTELETLCSWIQGELSKRAALKRSKAAALKIARTGG